MLSQLSNSSPGSEGSGSFLDHVPVEPWDAKPVTADASSSPTTGLSHVPVLVDCLTLLAQQIVENNNLMRELIQTQKELAKAINEDAQSGDDEELPRTYLDGSPVL